MTKLFTSVAVMQLCERGLVNLDQDVSLYLPELSKREVLESLDDLRNPIMRMAKNGITLRLYYVSMLYPVATDSVSKASTFTSERLCISRSEP